MKDSSPVWLVYDKIRLDKAGGYYELYFEHLAKRGIQLNLILIEELDYSNGYRYRKAPIQSPCAVIMRTYNLDLTKKFESEGIRVFNNSSVAEYGNNKKKAYELMAAKGIRIPHTMVFSKLKDVDSLSALRFPLVVKSLYGHGGEEVFWVNNISELKAQLLLINEDEYILQQPVSECGKDLRVYIVGNKIVAAMLRYNDKSFKSNYSLGGKASRYQLSERETTLVQYAASFLDIAMAGIDFMFDNGELIFNEIEDIAGARMLYANTDIDIVGLYADYIAASLRRND